MAYLLLDLFFKGHRIAFNASLSVRILCSKLTTGYGQTFSAVEVWRFGSDHNTKQATFTVNSER